MFHYLSLLQKTRKRLWVNSFFRFDSKSLVKMGFLGALSFVFVVGDYWFFRRILFYFNELPANVGEILIIQMLNLLCLTFFSMLVFSNVITSISAMYMSRDLDLLISSPIPIVDVFISKLILTLINSSWMAVLFSMPVFIAYGQVYYAPWQYYAVTPVLLIPFLLIPCCLGVLITMSLMRFFPARRTYQILSFVGLIFIAGLVMYFRFLEPEKFLGKDVPDEMIIAFVEKLKAPDYEWLPSSMMANSLQYGAFGDWERFTGVFFWFGAMAVAVVLVTILVASKIYYRGWTSSYGSSRLGSAPKRERLLYRAVRVFLSRASPNTRGMALKDIKLFWRDPGQWSQLFMLGALVIVYIFNIRNLPLNTLYLRSVVSVMNIGLAGVVLAAVAARFVFASTSVEGASFWAIKVAPVNFGMYLWGKFFLYLAPLLILAETLVVVSNILLGVDSYVMSVSAGAIALLTVGLTGLGVGMGAIYPKFDYENVAQIGVTSGAIIYMIISMAYAGVTVMLCARPVYTHLYKISLGRDIAGPEVWLSYLMMFVLTALFIYIPMKKGVVALENIEI